MPVVEITGWRVGFLKVSCTKVLQSSAGLGLADAKRVTDGVLDFQAQSVEVPSAVAADELAAALSDLGALAHVVPDP